ncbi:hypothetical protein N0V88_005772 [Collariella sp. IMI 366227]|nr:hypothetical protein N0V88_005772 [Collariella sp. IMI 366227]
MSGVSDTALLNEQASVKTSRSRASVVASIRHKTSSFFGRNVTNMADKDSQPIQVQPPPAKRHWFTSVGLRFSKGNHQALNSHESSSSDEARAEYWEQAGTGTIAPPSSPELSAAQPKAVNGNFRFSDDRGERSHPIKPAARPPVRTLWTIMSADSSE